MERKSDTVRRLVAKGCYKEALRIAKDFRYGLSKADLDAMKEAYECILYPRFYEQLGKDTLTAVKTGVEVIKRLYGS